VAQKKITMHVTIASVMLHFTSIRFDRVIPGKERVGSRVIRRFQSARVSRVRRHSDTRAIANHPILHYIWM